MLNERLKFLIIVLLGIGFFYSKDIFAVRRGSTVGNMKVNGTINYAVKDDLKEILPHSNYHAINLPPETGKYLRELSMLKRNYAEGKKFIMYDRAFNNSISCPYGQAFQKALQQAQSNEDNKISFDFYTKPQLKPFVSKKDMEKIKKFKMPMPADLVTEEEANIEMDFIDTCSLFCVVDPLTNHVISFAGVGVAEAVELQNLLDYLKKYDW